VVESDVSRPFDGSFARKHRVKTSHCAWASPWRIACRFKRIVGRKPSLVGFHAARGRPAPAGLNTVVILLVASHALGQSVLNMDANAAGSVSAGLVRTYVRLVDVIVHCPRTTAALPRL